MKKKIAIIGSGFSGLSAAAYPAKAGNEVHVFEKHHQPGGRARQFKTDNDYIIEDLFADFGHKTTDFFDLISLNPPFEMVFSDEKGAGLPLEKFMFPVIFLGASPKNIPALYSLKKFNNNMDPSLKSTPNG